MQSLRSRLVIASILWTAGLLVVTHMTFVFLAHRFPVILRFHLHGFVVFAALCLIGGVLQVRGGLKRFDALREQLTAVREGSARTIDGVYPGEVQPLVHDLNALLEQREEKVRRALAKAGDLAHGLKTPLAILAQEAERAKAAGHHALATTVSQQVERMRRQVDYHLAHARAAGSGTGAGARTSVLASAEALARTLLRLHAGRGVGIDLAVFAEHTTRVQREDLDEMLGNLLDNACKWAASRVAITSTAHPAAVTISVEDDGAGLDASMREAVLQRGVRADEAAPGSGLGLAIVRDLAELYGGSIALDASALGGLRARLRLPS